MPVRDLKSFLPTPEELLALDLPALAEILLVHLHSWKGEGKVSQPVGGLNRLYFVQVMEGTERGLGTVRRNEPEYGAKQPEVTRRMQEAWNWLEKEQWLMHNPDLPGGDWFLITSAGEDLLSRKARFESWEKLGVDCLKHDLLNGGFRIVGGPPENQKLAWEWVRMKEGQAMLPAGKRTSSTSGSSFIADSRIDELRKLASADFDFQRLIRLCEELNASYNDGNYYATAMLTRGLLDHVPPIFGHSTFAQVANNYSGGGRSFKEAMRHLEGSARNVADAHLHMPIRKSETLPTAQQVYCASQLDVLLSEVVRIMK